MRYVVGYEPNRRGDDAVKLAATLAGTRDAKLDIVVVLPLAGQFHDVYLLDRTYHAKLNQQGDEWLDRALESVPVGIRATTQIRRANSIAEGLIDVATNKSGSTEAALIVIGASHRGLPGRFTAGSVAASLLHSAPVPVALAPAGYQAQTALSRLTCATGTRQGADALLDVAIDSAARRRIPLRLMSLVALGPEGADGLVNEPDGTPADQAERHSRALADKADAALPGGCPVTAVVGRGGTVEAAVGALDFEPAEIVLVGSSRLAGPRRLFIGASANKMLRALPVPMVVVPRDYAAPPKPRSTDKIPDPSAI